MLPTSGKEGKEARWDGAFSDLSATKRLQQGAAETRAQLQGLEAKDHRVAACQRPERPYATLSSGQGGD